MSTLKQLDDYDQLATSALEAASLRHNLGILKSIVGGTELALRDPIDFDPRTDYWHLPERRFIVAYFAHQFGRWPLGEAEQSFAAFIVQISRSATDLRASGKVQFAGVDYERGGGIGAVLAPIRAWVSSFPSVREWPSWKVRREHAPTVAQSFQLFCDAVEQDGLRAYEANHGKRIRWFPILDVDSVDELRRRERFFTAYRHALMSHNSYRKAGAQFFAPIIGNTSTKVFLEALRKWRDGASREEAPLIAFDRGSKEPVDQSSTHVAGELWGFLNLHRYPFYNQRSHLYRTVHEDPERAVQLIGDGVRAWLDEHPVAVARLSERFDALVSDPATLSDYPRHSARSGRVAAGSAVDRALHDELMRTAIDELVARLPLDKAAILMHLTTDRIAYEDSLEWVQTVADAPRPPVAAESTLELHGCERVWLYAPGRRAQHWTFDREGGWASIGWGELGDLRTYGSYEALLAALLEQRDADDESEPTGAARTCWRFLHDVRPGDPILARKGRSRIIGIGVIDGEYEYVEGRDYPHRVPAKWLWTGEHLIRDRRSLPMQTLSQSSRRTSLLRELQGLLAPVHDRSDDADDEGVQRYTRSDALSDLFLPDSTLDEMLELLRRKKNVVLQGPPGVGKTFVARRLAYLLLGARDDERLRLVQFHQAYTYEQFVRGYRPDGKGGFELANGPLYEMAEKAKSDLDQPYVLMIDEINRGNLSKILGEGMMLLEADKRDEQWALELAYTRSTEDEEEEPFFLPPNLHVIGTMNTADRSLAVVDYALRRRFTFFDLEPGFDRPRFSEHLETLSGDLKASLLQRLASINRTIVEDPNLGRGFRIGHSYFCRVDAHDDPPWAHDAEGWIRTILQFEVLPLLREYWYDDPNRLAEAERVLELGGP